MLLAIAISMPSLRLLMLGGAAIILYVIGRIVMGAIPTRIDRSILRALVAVTSVLVVAITCAILNRPLVALHLPIAASAAALTFGLAALIVGRPLPKNGVEWFGLRSWGLVLPAVAIALIGGLGGRLDWRMMLALSLYGVAALLAWMPDPLDEPTTLRNRGRERARGFVVVDEPSLAVATPTPTFSETPVASEAAAATPAPAPATPDGAAVSGTATTARPSSGIGSSAFVLLLWIGSVGLAGLASVLAMYGLPALDAVRQVPSDALATVFLLAPAIVVPLVFELLPPCRPMGWAASLSTLAKFVVLNLCIVVPLVGLAIVNVDVIRGWAHLTEMKATTLPAATMPTLAVPTVTFPAVPSVALWADLLVLTGAALLLLPIAANWTRPGKLEAVALFACYLMNLVLVMGAMLR